MRMRNAFYFVPVCARIYLMEHNKACITMTLQMSSIVKAHALTHLNVPHGGNSWNTIDFK